MIEAVGHNYFPEYLAALDTLLAPNGVAVIQAITMPEARYSEYIHSTDFINTVRARVRDCGLLMGRAQFAGACRRLTSR